MWLESHRRSFCLTSSASKVPITGFVSDEPDLAIATPVETEPTAIATASHLLPRMTAP